MFAFQQQPTTGQVWGYALVLMVLIEIYIAPSIVAYYRGHHQKWTIVFLNLVGGWTLVGWVGAMIWACQKYDCSDELLAADYNTGTSVEVPTYHDYSSNQGDWPPVQRQSNGYQE